MSNDFETHERGTAKELQLSRELVNQLTQAIQRNSTLDPQVLLAYNNLMNHYEWQEFKLPAL